MTIEEFNRLRDEINNKTKPTKHHKSPEHDIQVRFVKWFAYAYPDKLMTAIPNAAKRSPRTGAYMKAEGLTAGMPDMLFPTASKGYNCLWIELKNGKEGRLSEAQKNMHVRLEEQGNLVKVARSFEECVDIVNEYFS